MIKITFVTMKDRIKKLMEKENLTPAQFAEIVGIQRSAVSHLVTGRNQPSVDVIQKILNAFRTINSDWLILGVGSMYRGEKQAYQPSLFEQIEENVEEKEVSAPLNIQKNVSEKIIKQAESVQKSEIPVSDINSAQIKSKTVNKIIVYYSDSTYEEFNK